MAPINYLFKIVVQFTSPLSEAAIFTRFTDDVVPDLEIKINQRLNPHIDGMVIARKTKLISMSDPPRFEFYPKATVTGDANKSDDFIERRIDVTYDDMKTIIDNDINAQGGSVDFWHRHLISGVVDEPG